MSQYTRYPVISGGSSPVASGAQAFYRSNAMQTMVVGVFTKVNFATQVYDTASAVTNPSTDWKFVAPADGFYTLTATIDTGAHAWVTGDYLLLTCYKNGARFNDLDQQFAQATYTGGMDNIHNSTTVQMVKGDTLEVFVYNSSNTDIPVSGFGPLCWVGISQQ